MSPKTPVVPPRTEGVQTTPRDRHQVAVSPPTGTAEEAAREVGNVISDVSLKILEALTAMHVRMARLELYQLKREEDERLKGAAESAFSGRRFNEVLGRHAWR
uniref:AlNc14C23G2344 protein n=1 Tax=Albugo laibachii Nc14 TaxID=890382 RepID=F0W642_9STRA|nr:AlNc14C23G2344 [Albugo laibachii Nc14]|eukprot:CCA16584.1 AlNc14C23G2344 [Albugo laibachii Nc14]